MEVTIRPLEEDDAKISYVWRNNKDIWKYTGSSPDKTITLDDELVWIREVIDEDDSYRFAIIVDNEYVGNIYLTGVNDTSAEYHVFIGSKQYMGRGVASKASKLIIKFAQDTLRLKSIFLEVRRENISAVRLYDRLGFRIDKEYADILNMRMDL